MEDPKSELERIKGRLERPEICPGPLANQQKNQERKMETEPDDFEEPYDCGILGEKVVVKGKADFLWSHQSTKGVSEPFRLTSQAITCDGFPKCKGDGVTVVGSAPCPFSYDEIGKLIRSGL